MTDVSNIEISIYDDNDNDKQNKDISDNTVKLLEERRVIYHILKLRDVVMRQTDITNNNL